MKHYAWIFVAFSLLGNVGVIYQQPWGMGCWIAANIGWIFHHIKQRDKASVTLFSVYLVLSVWGLIEWLRH